MKPRALLLLLLLLPLLRPAVAGAGPAVLDPSQARRPLAVIGGDTLTIADLDDEISATLAAAQGRELPPLDPAAVLKRLIQDRLLEQEGIRTGADQSPAVRNQVQDLVRLRSVNVLMDSVSALPPGVSPVDPKSLLGRVTTTKRFSHILVPDPAQARALRDSLDHGVPFADLARRHSTDPTAAQGGDLGWAAENAYIDEFEAAARTLDRGQIAGPVQTKFGWHLITLADVRRDTLKSAEMAANLIGAQERHRRTAAVQAYVAGLRQKYGVTVNDSLLNSLDYASEDPKVFEKLKSSEALLAVVPTGRLTVKGLTRTIQFQYFHGLSGHSDAAAIRNRMFDEWVTESLLSHEAHVLGLDRRPEIRRAAAQEQRHLLREEELKDVLNFQFKPADAEIRTYYQAHRTDYTPAPRIKVESALFVDQASARQFCDGLKAGSAFKWLLERSAGVVDAPPLFPSDWIDSGQVGFKGEAVAEGTILGPREFPGGWAVIVVQGVQKSDPTPLAACQDKVVEALRVQRTHQVVDDALNRLQAATPTSVLPGAKEAVNDRIAAWRAASHEGAKP